MEWKEGTGDQKKEGGLGFKNLFSFHEALSRANGNEGFFRMALCLGRPSCNQEARILFWKDIWMADRLLLLLFPKIFRVAANHQKKEGGLGFKNLFSFHEALSRANGNEGFFRMALCLGRPSCNQEARILFWKDIWMADRLLLLLFPKIFRVAANRNRLIKEYQSSNPDFLCIWPSFNN
ncbi:hypothetical protein COCNU_06G010150 [Cocos nucifera]|uniref:Uncharacterized protein n=1 Tax=Cocos nucifera TaxID=13894 RepID=A0A8K0IBG9_COCNU|nr:hypothetical protein COCNU_06G010150 [Cocos nucifera]